MSDRASNPLEAFVRITPQPEKDSGKFLHREQGPLEISTIQDGWLKARWFVERIKDANKHYLIKNQFTRDGEHYLYVASNGKLDFLVGGRNRNQGDLPPSVCWEIETSQKTGKVIDCTIKSIGQNSYLDYSLTLSASPTWWTISSVENLVLRTGHAYKNPHRMPGNDSGVFD
ncbi:MAG: hypothetical protein AAF490_03300 [Chloroflexota bacterium]